MSNEIPSVAEVRQQLSGIELADVRALAVVSGVPFTTLWKVRSGETENPGIETVRKFYGFIPKVLAVKEAAARANAAPAAIKNVVQGVA